VVNGCLNGVHVQLQLSSNATDELRGLFGNLGPLGVMRKVIRHDISQLKKLEDTQDQWEIDSRAPKPAPIGTLTD
jgi:hypothetical protein